MGHSRKILQLTAIYIIFAHKFEYYFFLTLNKNKEIFCKNTYTYNLHTMTFSQRVCYASGTRSTMSKSVNVFSILSGLGRPSVCGLHTLANKVPIVQFSASYLAIPSLFPLERMTLFLSVRPVDLSC